MKLPNPKEIKRLTGEARARAAAVEPLATETLRALVAASAAAEAARSQYFAADAQAREANREVDALVALAAVLRWPEEQVLDLTTNYPNREAPVWAVKAKAAEKPYYGSPAWLPAFVAARQWLLRWQQENP